MSYAKTEWKNGDIISAQKLNNIENAISSNIKDVSGVYEYEDLDDEGHPITLTTDFDNATIENDVINNIASAPCSHAEGSNTTASGAVSHAEGEDTTASGNMSHAEGAQTTASGQSSHAEGDGTTASGQSSHAEGRLTTASGQFSHAEGKFTTASGNYSHAEGEGTIASRRSQHVCGAWNISENTPASSNDNDFGRGTYVFIIGNGNDENSRSNAFAMKWDGTFVLANGTQITPNDFSRLLNLLS